MLPYPPVGETGPPTASASFLKKGKYLITIIFSPPSRRSRGILNLGGERRSRFLRRSSFGGQTRLDSARPSQTWRGRSAGFQPQDMERALVIPIRESEGSLQTSLSAGRGPPKAGKRACLALGASIVN